MQDIYIRLALSLKSRLDEGHGLQDEIIMNTFVHIILFIDEYTQLI